MKSNNFLFLFSILLSMVGTKALAYDFEAKNADGVTIYYNYINDGKELEVASGFYTYSVSVVIPEEVTYMNRTRKVTSIGKNTFYDCSGLTSVTIPNSVTSIGDGAFYDCRGLTSVTIPNSVTSIGNNAFSGCRGLTSVTFGNGVTSIGDGAFYDCRGLTSVTFGNGVTSIGGSAFKNCSGLTSVTIPNSVTSIGNGAFYDCSGLTSVTIPNSVTSIGGSAFAFCYSLTSVTIPSSVTSIGESAFSGCDIPVVISKIEAPFTIATNTFSNNTFLNATLYVPKGTIDKYKATDGWKKFAFIEEGDGSGKTPETQKCEKPTISYQNGNLTFYSATEGAVCHSTITDADIKSYSTNEVQLGVTYNITVYATKTGYENSETATATLCWIDVAPKTEGITNGVANVRAMPVMIQSQGGVLNITGAPEGSVINVYDLSGKMVESAISDSETTSIPTNLKSGEIGIVKIGDKSIKVVMQ